VNIFQPKLRSEKYDDDDDNNNKKKKKKEKLTGKLERN